MKTEVMNPKRRGIWEDLEEGKGKRKLCIFVLYIIHNICILCMDIMYYNIKKKLLI